MQVICYLNFDKIWDWNQSWRLENSFYMLLNGENNSVLSQRVRGWHVEPGLHVSDTNTMDGIFQLDNLCDGTK